MDFQKLKIFQYAVNCNFNLTNTAKALNTSQPGISRQIRELEEELGVELFIRVGKRLVGMTEPGEELLEIVTRVLADFHNIQGLAERFENNGQGLLRLGATASGVSFLPEILSSFLDCHPEVKLTLNLKESRGVVSDLIHDEADIGLAGEHMINQREIMTIPCFSRIYNVVVAKNHPLSKLSAITLADLAAYPLLTYSAGAQERINVDNAFSQAGLSPHIVLTANTASFVGCARYSNRVAIVCGFPDYLAFHKKYLTVLEAENLFGSRNLYLGIRRGKLVRFFERHFIQMVLSDLDPEKLNLMLDEMEQVPYIHSYVI